MTSALWLGLRKCKCGANKPRQVVPGVAQICWAPSTEWTGPLCAKHRINIWKGPAIAPCNLSSLCGRVGPHFRQGQPKEGWTAGRPSFSAGRGCCVLAS